MKQRLIIISPRQYGYQTDYLKYVEYLPEKYRVFFLCLDQGEKKFECNNAKIKYLKLGGKRLSYLWFMIYSCFYLLLHKGKVMTTNFSGCRFLKRALPWRKMIVNIRTVSVDENSERANKQNARIRHDASVFDRIVMISRGGAEQLNLPMEKVDIVGLGADVISDIPKSYSPKHLLYVGTLNYRDIPKTIHGFRKYVLLTGDTSATYDIIGDGGELQEIKDYVVANKLETRVHVHGRIHYSELKPFFDKCNIGVSFIPINEAYRYQPPTKTFEYINSGLYVIATRNQVHEEIVHNDSGILIDDTADDFCNALRKIDKMVINDHLVRNGGIPYLWRTIVMDELVKSLEKL